MGLQIARGEYVLFLDDDDEVEPDLIERHLRHITETEVQVSCGVAHEAGAGPLPEEFTFRRVSDVFPTNNCLIRHNVLRKSGLFDLAYERGQRADGDLGMRVYLSGALMALSPDISVFHHHAPLGGLRAHKARVITYASSRQLVSHRHLPSVSEIYLAERFFSPRQVREMLWQRAFATLSLRGPLWKRSVKTVLGIALMPHTILQIRRRHREARHMLNEFPQIPPLRGEAA